MDKVFLTYRDIMEILQCGKSKAYNVIKEVNERLESEGMMTIGGRISTNAFKKYYCL